MATDFWNNSQSSAPGPGAAAPGQYKPTPFDQAFGAYYTQAQPQFQSYDQQNNAALRDTQFGNYGLGLTNQGLQLGYQDNMNDLNTQRGQNSIDIAAAQRQPGLIDQLLASQNRDYDISRAGLTTNATKSRRDLDSDATARGAYRSGGVNKDRGTIYEQLIQGLGHIGESQTQNTLNAEEQKKQASDRVNSLNLTAQNLGMKPELLYQKLQLGLQQAGLSNTMDVAHLLDGIAQNDLAAKQLLQKIALSAGTYETARRG